VSRAASEKSFLERLTDLVPGVAGYRDREARRETDRRLREALASRLEESRGSLDRLRADVHDVADLRLLDGVGRLDRQVQKCIASLRWADQGYGGAFDQPRIREAELDRMYAFDEALAGRVRELADGIRRASPDTLTPLIREAERLDEVVSRRRELFHTATPIE
jgi:hypothetical protein